MTDLPPSAAPTTFRGTPPNVKQLAAWLGPRRVLWDGVVDMVKECGATWRWVFSEGTSSWTYRSYLPGERFFTALSLHDGGCEVSLNLKSEEWDTMPPGNPEETTRLMALRETALGSGEDPAWVHVPVTDAATLPLIAKLLFARGRRVQAPRRKGKR